MVSAKLERLGDLALVDAIEQAAVVYKETLGHDAPGCESGEHQVEAEYLHVGDALLRWASLRSSTVGPFGVTLIVRLPAFS